MLDLSETLTARVGGRLRNVSTPRGRTEFVRTIDELRQRDQRFSLLGGGSNVIAGDRLGDRAVVLTTGMREIREVSPTRWSVDAGANLTALGHKSASAGLSGLECCTGIPGTVGAAIRINAGGKYGAVSGVVREVTVLTAEGRVERRSTCPEDFSYRHSRFWDELILGAELEFEAGDAQECRALVREVVRHKRTTQPLRVPSAGCVFRNPPGDSAGRLIDSAGLKGTRVGGAMVSEVHANYLVNAENASGQDFVDLIALVRRRVAEVHAVDLELEIDLWSD